MLLPSFVLVHGAWHDASAWDQLRSSLGGRGLRSVAVDLPIDDVAVDASGYARLIADAASELSADGEPPVIVGHSMSGIAIPLVPALVPVRRLVFLGALIPAPGRTMASVQADEHVLGDTSAVARDAYGRSYWTSAQAAIEVMYHDCDPALAEVAAARLRPQARTPHDEPCPLPGFPDVPTSYFVMRDDRMIRPEWSRAVARRRLGVEPIELPGGHSPMLADPARLTDVLIALTRTDAREYLRRQ
ncbi:MAG TPA: alpha/beta hydrolase [Solirubrobacteraceae bacterium]|nr:alpha/beta hydrolase [Solirubrobacteraceae bacterium]